MLQVVRRAADKPAIYNLLKLKACATCKLPDMAHSSSENPLFKGPNRNTVECLWSK